LRPLAAADFRLPANQRHPRATAHVIGVIENQAPTRHMTVSVPVNADEVKPDLTQDIAKLAIIDRHHATGKVSVGLVKGFGFTARCAVATTVAHDCHQLLVVGTDEEQMAIAANAVAACDGGQLVVKEGKVIGQVILPIAGLMSDQAAGTVSAAAASVLAGFRECGCRLNNPNMQLSLLALVVIPELRLSDLGLIDVNNFNIIRVLE
ncbi:MAG TPA: adenine deaminase C-terminal domain-containing protein, partial [Spirochaetia bacterium]|nr:adenine deaminase C-terminal domain-containing protein [Spirochaetia bacterium]